MYIAFVAFALGVAGTALGFTFGVVPYFRSSLDLSQFNGFFLASVVFGALIGFTIGLANGAKWYRATEPSLLAQRRMLTYIKRHGSDARGVPQRTVNALTLRSLLGKRRLPKA